MSPLTANITYITVRATDTVTTSSMGVPSLGIPSEYQTRQLHFQTYYHMAFLGIYYHNNANNLAIYIPGKREELFGTYSSLTTATSAKNSSFASIVQELTC